MYLTFKHVLLMLLAVVVAALLAVTAISVTNAHAESAKAEQSQAEAAQKQSDQQQPDQDQGAGTTAPAPDTNSGSDDSAGADTPYDISLTDSAQNARDVAKTCGGTGSEICLHLDGVYVEQDGDGVNIRVNTSQDIDADQHSLLTSEVTEWYETAGNPYGQIHDITVGPNA